MNSIERRDFLKGSGAGAAATALAQVPLGAIAEEAAPAAAPVGQGAAMGDRKSVV